MDGVNVGRMEIRKEIFGFARRVIPFFRTSVASCDVCPANLIPNRVLATNDDKDATGIFRYILFFYQIRKVRILFVEKVYVYNGTPETGFPNFRCATFWKMRSKLMIEVNRRIMNSREIVEFVMKRFNVSLL